VYQKTIQIIKAKQFRHAKYIPLTMCIYFFICQAIEIYQDYYEYNIKMKVDFTQVIRIPSFVVSLTPDLLNETAVKHHVKIFKRSWAITIRL